MATGTATRKNQISQETFITEWVKAHKDGDDMRKLAERLGISYNAVATRGKSYINKGIKLPELKRGQRGKSVDTDGLNSLLDSLLKGEEVEVEGDE